MFYHTWQFWFGGVGGFAVGAAAGIVFALFSRGIMARWRGEIRDELKGK